MNIINNNIDNGKAFDWGRTSKDYSKYRDIYPQEFYDKIIQIGLCKDSQVILDLGTGTGVLPRNMYHYGGKWIGTDISENQIKQAKILSENMNINYYAVSAENIDFPENTFDVITACQCFWYFDHDRIIPNLYRMLKPNGILLILYMAWLPYEDKIAQASEELVLKYNPNWSGAGEIIHPIWIPDIVYKKFEMQYHDEYPLKVRFTRETWNGRIKSCRGIGASLSENEIKCWEKEHKALLNDIAPDTFEILHYGAIAALKKV